MGGTLSLSPRGLLSPRAPPSPNHPQDAKVTPLDERQSREEEVIQLVEQSWRRVKELEKLGLVDIGVLLFKKMFTVSPETLQLFSFQFEKDIYASHALKHHGNLVMVAIDKAVANIRDLTVLTPYLDELGKSHADMKRGIQPHHFDLMQSQFIEVLREVLDDDFTPEVEHAWYVLSVRFFKVVAAGEVIETINLEVEKRESKKNSPRHNHHHHHDDSKAGHK